jgi:hypothetical protein
MGKQRANCPCAQLSPTAKVYRKREPEISGQLILISYGFSAMEVIVNMTYTKIRMFS